LTTANVPGVLSLILWSLLLVISLKYLTLVLRANNDGEGGVLALMVLTLRGDTASPRRRWIVLLGLFGAGLLYGDGVITPAISVLSAVEGLRIAAPALQAYVLPLTILQPDHGRVAKTHIRLDVPQCVRRQLSLSYSGGSGRRIGVRLEL
jgi:KUP system potassium uptake protein